MLNKNITSLNSTFQSFEYDAFGRAIKIRETVPDGKYLEKAYTYSGGNVTTIGYTSQGGLIGTEYFVYANGHNTEIKLNNTTTIWKLTAENDLGQPIAGQTGPMIRTYSYSPYGIPTGRTAGSLQDFNYNFDPLNGNLLSRKDNKKNITESFQYDNLNRLSMVGGSAISYSPSGNLTYLPGTGTMTYGSAAKPYAVTMLSPDGNAVPAREQQLSYTSFNRPSTITENGVSAAFTYNDKGERVKMSVTNNGTNILTRYYLSGQYEIDNPSNTERLYLGGDAYSAPAAYVKEAGVWKVYYLCGDHLGSITQIANADGSLKQELSYTAWGRLRNPATQVAYSPGTEPTLFLGRGYTGHEYLPWFGLINMNARLYDAALGRFLAPDPHIQLIDFTQNFNRYSYCLNNPLKFIDPSGNRVAPPQPGMTLVNPSWIKYIGGHRGSAFFDQEFGAGRGSGGGNVDGVFGKPGEGGNGTGVNGIYYDHLTGTYRDQYTYHAISNEDFMNFVRYGGIEGLTISYYKDDRISGRAYLDVSYTAPGNNGAQWKQWYKDTSYICTSVETGWDGDNNPYYYTDAKMAQHTHGNTVDFYDGPRRTSPGSYEFTLYLYKSGVGNILEIFWGITKYSNGNTVLFELKVTKY